MVSTYLDKDLRCTEDSLEMAPRMHLPEVDNIPCNEELFRCHRLHCMVLEGPIGPIPRLQKKKTNQMKKDKLMKVEFIKNICLFERAICLKRFKNKLAKIHTFYDL